jgi:hypothetical protein
MGLKSLFGCGPVKFGIGLRKVPCEWLAVTQFVSFRQLTLVPRHPHRRARESQVRLCCIQVALYHREHSCRDISWRRITSGT